MPVTLNVHSSAAPGAALRLGYSFAVVCTFPLQMMPIADMVRGRVRPAQPSPSPSPNLSYTLALTRALALSSCTTVTTPSHRPTHTRRTAPLTPAGRGRARRAAVLPAATVPWPAAHRQAPQPAV